MILKHATLGYEHVLRPLIMKWQVNEHDMLKRKTIQLGFFPYAFLHDRFERLKLTFRPWFLHESCSMLSLVSIGTNLSFIAIFVCEIWPV